MSESSVRMEQEKRLAVTRQTFGLENGRNSSPTFMMTHAYRSNIYLLNK
jgi:hypothetical protein